MVLIKFYRLTIYYIGMRFHENIVHGFQIIDQTLFCVQTDGSYRLSPADMGALSFISVSHSIETNDIIEGKSIVETGKMLMNKNIISKYYTIIFSKYIDLDT